jgi:hypothetical protein
MKEQPARNGDNVVAVGLTAGFPAIDEQLDVPSQPDCGLYAIADGTLLPSDGQGWIEEAYISAPTGLIVVPEFLSPEHLLDTHGAYLSMLSARLRWFLMRWRSQRLTYEHFINNWFDKEPDGSDQNPNTAQAAMAYGNRAKKNAGAWFRANEIVRHNPTLRTTINADTQIRAAGSVMLGHINTIATANGYNPSDDGLTVESKSVNMFPITKQMWMGYLPFSTYGEEGEDEHRTEFAEAAKNIRDRFTDLVKSWKLAKDAYNVDVEGNPGGTVDETD